ncbi:DNA-directed RNA polymerases I and III subunit [Lachnellula willkommii]|uniref:DNA-directed RNA polymerases I and III subunit n=1 Tax=Lachnellula willkommii TaxID=215461 RepID=A0A559M6Q7_9HELO|nr:DNA-directed RNA polymerases I and III subunit [Lachnellula willkommii]
MAPKTKPAEAVASEDDVSMNDEPAVDTPSSNDDPHNPARMAFGEQRIRILPGSSDTAASFEFKGEDHTLGNALRYIIMKKYAPSPSICPVYALIGFYSYAIHLADFYAYSSPKVEFCGYSIPHPSEDLMNIRIQTYEGTASEALEKGLDDLSDLCDVVEEKFIKARDEYGTPMET